MTMIQTFPAGGGVGVPSGGTKGQALVKNSNTDKDVTWSTITPGHIIEDSAAAATQRDTVQIKGLSISDDSTNQKTVIEGVGLNSDSLDDIASGSVNNIFVQPSYDYSTTEKIVGKWIDGKPIYQKTVDCGTSLSIMNHNIANIDKVIDASGIGFGNHGDGYNIPFAGTNWIQCYADRTKIDLQPATSGWNLGGGIYITLKYTKTTD